MIQGGWVAGSAGPTSSVYSPESTGFGLRSRIALRPAAGLPSASLPTPLDRSHHGAPVRLGARTTSPRHMSLPHPQEPRRRSAPGNHILPPRPPPDALAQRSATSRRPAGARALP
eukprot:scaffold4685_cov92-Isochrysis_galbana.AAC.4